MPHKPPFWDHTKALNCLRKPSFSTRYELIQSLNTWLTYKQAHPAKN